jgi:hypothetical protein
MRLFIVCLAALAVADEPTPPSLPVQVAGKVIESPPGQKPPHFVLMYPDSSGYAYPLAVTQDAQNERLGRARQFGDTVTVTGTLTFIVRRPILVIETIKEYP